MSKRKLKTWYRNLPILKQLNNKGIPARKSLIIRYRHRLWRGTANCGQKLDTL